MVLQGSSLPAGSAANDAPARVLLRVMFEERERDLMYYDCVPQRTAARRGR